MRMSLKLLLCLIMGLSVSACFVDPGYGYGEGYHHRDRGYERGHEGRGYEGEGYGDQDRHR